MKWDIGCKLREKLKRTFSVPLKSLYTFQYTIGTKCFKGQTLKYV